MIARDAGVRRADAGPVGSSLTSGPAGSAHPPWRAVLDFESAATALGLPVDLKARWIREDLGLGVTRYVQILMRAIELPEALEYAPSLVALLRRRRDQRRALRRTRALGAVARTPPSPWHPSLDFVRGKER